MAIREEKRIAEKTKNNQKLEGLINCLKAYEEQKRIIEECMDNGQTEQIDPKQIKNDYNQLISLPLTGKSFKELFDCEIRGQNEQVIFEQKNFFAKN